MDESQLPDTSNIKPEPQPKTSEELQAGSNTTPQNPGMPTPEGTKTYVDEPKEIDPKTMEEAIGGSHGNDINPNQVNTAINKGLKSGGKVWLWITAAGVIATVIVATAVAIYFFNVRGAGKTGTKTSTSSNAVSTTSSSGQYTDLQTQLKDKFDFDKLVYVNVTPTLVESSAFTIPLIKGTKPCATTSKSVVSTPDPTSKSYAYLSYPNHPKCGALNEFGYSGDPSLVSFNIYDKSKNIIGTGGISTGGWPASNIVSGGSGPDKLVNSSTWADRALEFDRESTYGKENLEKTSIDSDVNCVSPTLKVGINSLDSQFGCMIYVNNVVQGGAKMNVPLQYFYRIDVKSTNGKNGKEIDKEVIKTELNKVYETYIKNKIKVVKL